MENRETRERAVFEVIEKSKNDSLDVALDKMTAALHEKLPHYTGVYLYLLDSTTLVLGPYRGRPTEHTRIPVGAGVCGRAARIKQTVIVDNVKADPEYLACSLETQSEIVVPIMHEDRVLGEIDIDSDVPAAFSIADKKFLEEVARRVAPRFDREKISD